MQRENCQDDTPKCISAFTHLNNVLPVASEQASASRSIRKWRDSIREIHGPVRRPLSEIDGSRSRSTKGQLPWRGVSSLSFCHPCLGRVIPGVGEGGETTSNATPRPQRLSPAQADQNNII